MAYQKLKSHQHENLTILTVITPIYHYNLHIPKVKQSPEVDIAGTRSEVRNTSVKILSGSVLTDTELLSDPLEERTRILLREQSNSAVRLVLFSFLG